MLLDSTPLPVTEVALCSGFSSIRRFNDAFRRTFEKTPTEVRDARAHKAPASGDLELKLNYRPPLDWNGLIGFIRVRAIPGVECVDGNTYRRTVRIGDATGTLHVTPADGRPCAKIGGLCSSISCFG